MSEDPTGSGSGDLGGASGVPATGGSTGAAVAGGATAAVRSPNGGASRLGRLVSGLPLPVHDHETPSTGGELDAYLRTAWGTVHLTPGADAHPEYATDVGLAAVQAQLEAVYTEAEADARFEHAAEKGQANGYAALTAEGLIPTAQLPPLAINETFVVASQAAMLALVAQVGDMAIRTDSGLTYVLAAAPPGTLANWKEVLAAGQVQSVNGETGVVSLSAADVGAAAVDHTHPSEESGQWRFQNNPTIADPGTGYLRGNTGVLATSTTLAFSRTTQDGYDIPPPGWGVRAGDTIYIQDRDDSTRWVRYTANEPLAQFATYATGVVTVIGSAGSLPHGTVVQATFSLAGGGGGGGGGTTVAADALWDAKGDLAVASGADAAARLAAGTNGQVLTADSAQTLGLKWATPAAPGALATDPLADAKGDVFAASANNAVGRLAVGANDAVLTADSTQTLGVRWAAPATQDHGHGGGAGSGGALAGTVSGLVLIQEQALSGASAAITFSSIPGTYRTLVLVSVARSDGAGTGGAQILLRFNGDATANYDWLHLSGSGTGATAGTGLSATSGNGGNVPLAGDRASVAGTNRLEVLLYAGTTFWKTALVDGTNRVTDAATGLSTRQLATWWRSTAAVTQIGLTLSAGNFIAGSYAALYGMA